MQILKNVASVAKKFTKKSRISAVCRPCDKSTTVELKVNDLTAPVIVSGKVEDYKTLSLTFNEAVQAKDEESFSVTVDKKVVAAADISFSEDGKTVYLAKADGWYTELTEKTFKIIVTGLTDKASNELKGEEETTFEVKKAASDLAKVTFNTKTLPAGYNTEGAGGTYDATKPNDKYNGVIELAGVDQYGAAFDLSKVVAADKVEVTAKVGTGDKAMPLVIGKGTTSLAGGNIVNAADDGTIDNKIYISNANASVLTKDKVVTINVTKGDEKTLIGSATYTLEEYKAPVATTIDKIIVEDNEDNKEITDNNLTSGKTYTLSAEWKDQFGNVFPTASTPLTWSVSDKTIATVSSTAPATTTILSAVKDGEVTVTAFLSDTESKSVTFTVSAPKVSKLETEDIAPSDKFNHEEVKATEITANSGAVLTPEILKVKVVSKPESKVEGQETPDPTVTFAKQTTADGKEVPNTVVATIKTSVAGEYKLVYYVGDSFEAEDTVKADGVSFTSTVNPNVAKILIDPVTKLPSGSEVKKEIKFQNQHGEEVSVDADALKVDATKLTVTKYNAAGGANTGDVTELGFTGGATKGVGSVSINTGTAPQVLFSVDVVDAAELSSVDLGSNSLEVINKDSYDADVTAGNTEDTNDTVIVNESGNNHAYKLTSFALKDQYGNVMQKHAKFVKDLLVKTGTDEAKYSVKFFDKNKNALADTDDATDVAYIGVYADKDDAGTEVTPGEVKVSIYDKKHDETGAKVIGTLTLTAKDARKVNTVTATPASATALTGTPAEFELKAVDQYNDPIDVNTVTAKAAVEHVTLTDGVAATATTGKKFSLTADVAGKYDYTVKAKAATGAEKDVTVTLIAKSQGEIDKIEINPVVTDGTTPATKYDTAHYQLPIDMTNNTRNASSFVLDFKAFDSNGDAVNVGTNIIPNDGVTVKSVTDKDGDPVTRIDDDDITYVATTGILTFGADNTFAEGDKVTLEATSTLGKTATLTFTVGKKGASQVVQEGTQYIVDDATSADKRVAITEINASKTAKKTVLAVDGKDQFGQLMKNTGVKCYSLNEKVATVKETGVGTGKFEITPVSEGDAEIKFNVAGNKELKVTVHVSKDAVDTIPTFDYKAETVYISNKMKYKIDTTASGVSAGDITTTGTGSLSISSYLDGSHYLHVKAGDDTNVKDYLITARASQPTINETSNLKLDEDKIKIAATQEYTLDGGKTWISGTGDYETIQGLDTTAKALEVREKATATKPKSVNSTELYIQKAATPTNTEFTGATFKNGSTEGLKFTAVGSASKYQVAVKSTTPAWTTANAISANTAVTGTATDDVTGDWSALPEAILVRVASDKDSSHDGSEAGKALLFASDTLTITNIATRE